MNSDAKFRIDLYFYVLFARKGPFVYPYLSELSEGLILGE